MIDPDNPYCVFLESNCIQRAQERENARDRDNAGETLEGSGDWLVRLIERKLRGEA